MAYNALVTTEGPLCPTPHFCLLACLLLLILAIKHGGGLISVCVCIHVRVKGWVQNQVSPQGHFHRDALPSLSGGTIGSCVCVRVWVYMRIHRHHVWDGFDLYLRAAACVCEYIQTMCTHIISVSFVYWTSDSKRIPRSKIFLS